MNWGFRNWLQQNEAELITWIKAALLVIFLCGFIPLVMFIGLSLPTWAFGVIIFGILVGCARFLFFGKKDV